MSDSRKKVNNGPVKSPVECCPKPTIDLEYLDCRGKGIAGATYHVHSVNWDGKKDGKFSKSGKLDGNGQAHIDDVPEIKALEYYFEKDPKPYEPEFVPSKNPDRDETVSMLDSIAIWLVDTAKGDFNKEQTIGQITVNALLGLIPVVDQVLDARDLTAGLKAIIDYYMEDEAEQQKHPDELGLDYEKWIWINVFIIAIGCIPIVGSAVKGVLKGVVHYLKSTGKTAAKLSPTQLRAGWEFLVKILNHFGVGNAHKWLKVEFPAKIDGWMNTASKTIRGALDTIEETANKAVSAVSFFSSTKAAEIAERFRLYKKAIDKTKSKIDDMADQAKAWFKEQFQTLTGGAHKSEKVGATGTKSQPIVNSRHQIQADSPSIRVPINNSQLRKAAKEIGLRNTRIRQGTNGKVAVIGRSMDDAVNPYADLLKKKGFEVETFTGPSIPKDALDEWELLKKHYAPEFIPEAAVKDSKLFAANKSWAEKLKSEGFTVVDVGNPSQKGPSPFYEMEQLLLFGD